MLKVRALTVLHHPGQELTDISLTVGRGEAVAIVGPSGSGKSLLLATIVEQTVPYQGDVIVNHFKASAETERVQQLLGALLSPFNPPLHLTGFEYLDLVGAYYHLEANERTERIINLIKIWQVGPAVYQTMEEVDLATRQKIGLIASLLAATPVVVWDEPSQFLDPTSQAILRQQAELLKKNGTSILLATNNLDLAERLADYFIVLEKGRILAEGSLTQMANATRADKNLEKIYAHLIGHA